jgi:hypothetical protein
VNQDKINGVMISDQVAKMGSFDAIILLYKGDDVRKDLSVTYILSELQSMMPKDFNSNLIVVFSHVSNPTSIPGIKHLKDMKIPTDKIVIMDNECYLSPDLIRAPTSESAEDKATRKRIAEKAWRRTPSSTRLSRLPLHHTGRHNPTEWPEDERSAQKKISLGEKTEEIMTAQGKYLAKMKVMAKEEKELGYTRQDMLTENSRIFVHMGKVEEVMVKAIVEEEVEEIREYIVVKCSKCTEECERCIYSKEYLNNVQNQLNNYQSSKCYFKKNKHCEHPLSSHKLTVEKHKITGKKPKEVFWKELQQVKEINLTAQKKRDELLQKITTMIKKLITDRKDLRSLSASIRALMKAITLEHRSIVSESMLPPSDPLETRLEKEIMDLKDRADRNDPRAAEELGHMEALLRLYNEVKDEVDGKVKPEVPENEDRDGRGRNGNARYHNGLINHNAQNDSLNIDEGPIHIKQMNQSHPRFISSFTPSNAQQQQAALFNSAYNAQYIIPQNGHTTNQHSKIGLLDGGSIGANRYPIPQPAQQRAAPGYRPIENKYDGNQVNEALARANALMAADADLHGLNNSTVQYK